MTSTYCAVPAPKQLVIPARCGTPGRESQRSQGWTSDVTKTNSLGRAALGLPRRIPGSTAGAARRVWSGALGKLSGDFFGTPSVPVGPPQVSKGAQTAIHRQCVSTLQSVVCPSTATGRLVQKDACGWGLWRRTVSPRAVVRFGRHRPGNMGNIIPIGGPC